jgi:hypothetical protein
MHSQWWYVELRTNQIVIESLIFVAGTTLVSTFVPIAALPQRQLSGQQIKLEVALLKVAVNGSHHVSWHSDNMIMMSATIAETSCGQGATKRVFKVRLYLHIWVHGLGSNIQLFALTGDPWPRQARICCQKVP